MLMEADFSFDFKIFTWTIPTLFNIQGFLYIISRFLSNKANILFSLRWTLNLSQSFSGWCRGLLLGQSFVLSDSERCLLKTEDQFGSRPYSFPGLCHMRSGTSPERFRSSPKLVGSWESHQDSAPKMRFSVQLNSWDNFFVTLPSISSKTWVK